eukprot:2621438-Prymnesium_polylepis.2
MYGLQARIDVFEPTAECARRALLGRTEEGERLPQPAEPYAARRRAPHLLELSRGTSEGAHTTRASAGHSRPRSSAYPMRQTGSGPARRAWPVSG